MSYGQGFYDTIRAGCQASAAVVVPLVLDAIPPAGPRPLHVVDVGCGEGWWAHAFATFGCHVLGIDGGYVTASALGGDVVAFVAHDLTTSLAPLGMTGSDLAVSLEVAEHLPESRASSFVDDLCALAPAVLFSAAIPGQGGTGHINEQWPDYWVKLFEAHDYTVSGALRLMIWNDDRVENWYRQNLLFAARSPQDYPTLFDTPLAPPWPLVHPVLYNARRGA